MLGQCFALFLLLFFSYIVFLSFDMVSFRGLLGWIIAKLQRDPLMVSYNNNNRNNDDKSWRWCDEREPNPACAPDWLLMSKRQIGQKKGDRSLQHPASCCGVWLVPANGLTTGVFVREKWIVGLFGRHTRFMLAGERFTFGGRNR